MSDVTIHERFEQHGPVICGTCSKPYSDWDYFSEGVCKCRAPVVPAHGWKHHTISIFIVITSLTLIGLQLAPLLLLVW